MDLESECCEVRGDLYMDSDVDKSLLNPFGIEMEIKMKAPDPGRKIRIGSVNKTNHDSNHVRIDQRVQSVPLST